MKRFLPKQKKVLVLLLALLAGLGTAYAYSFSAVCTTGQTLYYNIIDDANHYVEITCPGALDATGWDGYIRPTGNITLPSTVSYNGVNYTVTAIGNRAFRECDGLTGSLTIPNSVTSIGESAFRSCTGFTGSLTIPNSVTLIDSWAFYYCNGFTGSLTIPNSVIEIGEFAFRDCSSFTGSLTLGNSLTTIGNCAFERCDGFTGSLTIPNLVTTIGENAFYLCSGFNGSLTIGTSVTEIGISAFYGCTGFTGTLTIGNSVTTIDKYAFASCSSFTGDLVIPNSVTTIGFGAFNQCHGFMGTLTIGNSVTAIDEYAFASCSGFTGDLVIPNSVTTIGFGAFNQCYGFTGTLTIGHSVTSIGESAFKNCIGITQVQFNALNCGDFPLEGINNPPFQNITGTLSFGNHVQRIPQCMFWNCSGLTGELTIPNSVTEIGYGAFHLCTGFEHLYLGSSLTSIGVYAFYYCSGLTGSLTIPESVTTLYDYAFAGCQGIDSVDIGSNVSTINYGAFYECIGLTSMTVRPVAAPNLGDDVFNNVSRAIPVYIPYGSIMSYHTKEGWRDFTNYQYIPWTVTLTTNPYDGGNAVFVEGNGTYAHTDLCRVQATPNSNYQFMHWRKNGGICSSDANYRFLVIEDTEMEAVFMPLDNAGTIIGEGETTNNIYLPSYTMYNYSLTEQIYTTDELGGNFTIYNISFFNAGSTVTRSFDIYLKQTDKTVFSGPTDWINATSSDMVYSGSVTMRAGMWTTIVLDTPFAYNADSSSPNLVLIVDDNTGDWDGGLSCRVFKSQGCQALRVYSDNNNYNPSSVSSYGSDMYVKNQIIFNRPVYTITATPNNAAMGTVTGAGQYGYGDLCQLNATANSGRTFLDWVGNDGVAVSDDTAYEFIVTGDTTLTANFIASTDVCNLTFNLDNYDQGWGGNYLEVHFGNGMSHLFGVLNDEGTASYTLPFVNGSHVVLNMQSGTFSDQCPFEVRYANGNLACASVVLTGESSYEFDMDCDEMPAEWAFVGYGDDINDVYLPSYSYYNYTLSQQIYTANEIGTAGNISSIAFYNQSIPGQDNTKTRTYDIYLKPTNKFEFFNEHDWISVSLKDKVFSGSVTMVSNEWTVITFDRPFVYDGISNLVLVMDDNTGDFSYSPHMACRIYEADSDQTLRVYSDGTNYDPMSPPATYGSYEYVAVMNEKNQVYFGFTSSLCGTPVFMTTTDITSNSATLGWSGCQDSYNLRYKMACDFFDNFENGLDGWTTIRNNEGNSNTDWHAYDASNYSGGSDHSGGYVAASFSWWGGSAYNVDNWLITPPVTLGGTLSFWVSGSTDWLDKYYVCVSTTRPSIDAFTVLGGERYPTGEWTMVTVDLSAYAGQRGYIAIHHQDYDKEFLWIDDFGIYSEWEELNEVTSPVTISGLAPATDYVWQVQGNNTSCDGGVTDWSEQANFTTFCGTVIVDANNPFYEGFEDTTFVPVCWETFSTDTRPWTRNTVSDYVHSGSASAYSYFFGERYLVLPDIELSANASAAQLTFWSYNRWPNDFAVGNNTVVLLNGGSETVLWSADTVSEEWVKTTVNLSAYLGQTISLAFKYAGSNGNGWYVDDVEISAAPATVTQTIALTSGTNWFSTYLDITLADLQHALNEALPSATSMTIKSKNSTSRWNGSQWRNANGFVWDVAKMYMIVVPEDCELVLNGTLINPAEHTITIEAGTPTWIGFPFSESKTFSEAIPAGFAVNGDQIKYQNATARFNGTNWRGSAGFTGLEPGKGYMYVPASSVTEDRILIFPTGAK